MALSVIEPMRIHTLTPLATSQPPHPNQSNIVDKQLPPSPALVAVSPLLNYPISGQLGGGNLYSHNGYGQARVRVRSPLVCATRPILLDRCLEGREETNIEVVALNDSRGPKNAAHLLKYDSILGTFDADVSVIDDKTISVNGKEIAVLGSRDPAQLGWGDLGVDVVIEGTGVFVNMEGASKHLQAGAKKVVITAPAKGDDIPTYVVGVNEKDYTNDTANIVSNASCTTNCLAPFAKVLDDEFGIIEGTMTTTHSYTGDQRLLDASHRDLRRARAAALNIVPTTTGAAKAVSLVLPNLKGKLNGIALRVPTPNVSVVDLVVNVKKQGVTAEEVNAAFKKAAEGPMKGILAVEEKPLVSVDYRASDVSSTIDASLTMVMGESMVKVVAWYDNEWGYSQRVVDLAEIVASHMNDESTTDDPLERFCESAPDADECRVYDD